MRKWLIVIGALAFVLAGCSDDDGGDDQTDRTEEADAADQLAGADSCEELVDVALEITEERAEEFDTRLSQTFS